MNGDVGRRARQAFFMGRTHISIKHCAEKIGHTAEASESSCRKAIMWIALRTVIIPRIALAAKTTVE